jgi:hypothetical protein
MASTSKMRLSGDDVDRILEETLSDSENHFSQMMTIA